MKMKFNSLKSSAKKRNLPLNISFEYFKNLKTSNCYYCGVSNIFLQFFCEVMGRKMPYMSIDRIDNTKGYIIGNVVPACFLCNQIKGSFFNEEEMKRIGKEFVAPKLKTFEQEAYELFEEWCENNI